MREYSDYQCDQDDDEPEAPLPPGWLEGEEAEDDDEEAHQGQ